MSEFYLYLHDRLFCSSFNRQAVIQSIVKKMLKSVARSTAVRINTNKWIKAVDFLVMSVGGRVGDNPNPTAVSLLDALAAELDTYSDTHPVSVIRCKFMLRYIALTNSVDSSVSYSTLAVAWNDKFQAVNDGDWLVEFATHRMDLTRTDCGHWSNGRITYWLRGNRDTYDWSETVCSDCAVGLANETSERVLVGRDFLLREFVVDVRHQDGDRIPMDRRSPMVRHSERHGYHHVHWSPYYRLVDNYHSSRNKGFAVIESPWFKRHRRAFGLELEVQVMLDQIDAAAGRVHDMLNPSGDVGEYCYFERDGSIGDGFELISQPAGLDIHRDKLALFLNNAEVKRNMRSHEGGSCGLHIHVGRRYVTQAQIYRMQSFLNDVRNEGLIKLISRRYNSNYARVRYEMAKLSPHGKNTGERYEALNVTNRDTIEFRIFRGSLRYESVMAALEFVNALIDFCMPGQVSIMDFNAIGFRKWLSLPSNRIDTEHLRPYLSINPTNDNENVRAAA